MIVKGHHMNKKINQWLVTLAAVAVLFPLQSFALHQEPIGFPDNYPGDSSILDIQYCDPALCPLLGFMGVGSHITGWFSIHETPPVDIGQGTFTANEISDYAIFISQPESWWTEPTLTPANTHLGDGSTGPVTSWYYAGMPTIASGGILWRDYETDSKSFVSGIIELTALTPALGSDIGLKFFFDLDRNQLDVYSNFNPTSGAVVFDSYTTLVASTSPVPLPDAAFLLLNGLVALLTFRKSGRKHSAV
jgi:hypothetical protein